MLNACCRARLQKADYGTPDKLKALLADQGIQYEPDATPPALKGLARRCLKRMLSAAGDVDPQAMHGYAKSIDVKHLKQNIEEAKSMMPTDKVWEARPTKGILDAIASASVLKCKHNIVKQEDEAQTCFGVVRDGVCSKCNEHTPGIVTYSMELIFRDWHDATKVVYCSGAQTAGIGLFGMTAQAFNALSVAEQTNKMWEPVEQPFVFKAVHEFRASDNNVHTTAFNVQPLPMRLLPSED